MSAARAPAGGRVAKTALWAGAISLWPFSCAAFSMSVRSARADFSASAIIGTKSGRMRSLDIRKETFQYSTGNLTLSGVAMKAQSIRPQVERIFARGPRRTLGTAVEQE